MVHVFDRACNEHGITHKLTKPYHPWTNGQAERMNRTVKDGTVKVFHYETVESLKAHVLAFVTAYNFTKHLKALRWRTPFQSICDTWAKDPTPFKINPHHLIPGPHTRAVCLMELKDVLGEIEADGAHLVHGCLLEWSATPPLWHAEAVGDVRPVPTSYCLQDGCLSSRLDPRGSLSRQ